MRRIYLTINIDVTDSCFDKFTDCEKINIGDVIKENKKLLRPFELEKIRGKVVADAILENEKNLLIGFAIKSHEDLKTVLELAGGEKENIFKIYFDNGKRKKAAIEKYKKDYSLHSRWLDYSPEYVENSYIEFDKKIKEIKKYAIGKRVELISV